jgi:uncharacterized phage-associated protein
MSDPHLRFRFNLDKLVNALAFFAAKNVKGLTVLKAAKLLYLADQYHFHHYGRPVTGDSYVAMELGPVPETAYQLLSRIVAGDEVNDAAKEHLLRHLSVYRGWWGTLKYPLLRLRTRPDIDVFSESDLEALHATVNAYGNVPARQLVDLTHEHQAYKKADSDRAPYSSVPLPYEYFLADAPDALREEAQALAERHQEARRFTESLREAGSSAVRERRQLAHTRG